MISVSESAKSLQNKSQIRIFVKCTLHPIPKGLTITVLFENCKEFKVKIS